jgi:hypothetical protein
VQQKNHGNGFTPKKPRQQNTTRRIKVEVQVGAWLMQLFMVQVDYKLFGIVIGAWLMTFVYGAWLITGCLVQVGAWLMHLFMVQVDYRLIGTGLQQYIS